MKKTFHRTTKTLSTINASLETTKESNKQRSDENFKPI